MTSSQPLFGLSRAELAAVLGEAGEPAWRGAQLAEAIYRQRIQSVGEISTFSRELRERLLAKGLNVCRPRIAQVFRSVDGTERYLVEGVAGPETVETVWMPEGDDGEAGDGTEEQGTGNREQGTEKPGERDPSASLRAGSGIEGPFGSAQGRLGDEGQRDSGRARATICVSSQVGCAVNCQFCLTAKLGLQRNLTAGEIAGQVVAVLDRQGVEIGRDRVNLVFMGMGEPFLNYDNFMSAVRLLVEEVGLSPQRMTVSTSGIVTGIVRFAAEPAEIRPKLAISLNAPDNAVRSEVMPINRKWPIEAVVDAVQGIRLRPRERVTFEYVLLAGVTDRPEQARMVAKLVRRSGLPAKVNLIAWNPGPGIPYRMPEPEAIEQFRQALGAEGVAVYLRRPRGRDIYAACGQLKRTVEG